jgi:acyl transferase domain-containing protein
MIVDPTSLPNYPTRTPLGDPIEANAIGAAFRKERTHEDPMYTYVEACLVLPSNLLLTSPRGSIKSNIGHLEGASGLAGIIKGLLILEQGIIPPNANFEKLNPNIDDVGLNIKVCKP